jgi:hypothetical protein
VWAGVLVGGGAWGVGGRLLKAGECGLEDAHLLVATLAFQQEVADAVLEGKFLAVEAGGQVVGAWVAREVPIGGAAGWLLEVNRVLFCRKGT